MKKAFTLIEILGVIVVLGLLLMLVIPTILNGVKNKEDEVNNVQDTIIYEATGQYIDANPSVVPNVPGTIKCLKLTELKEKGALDSALDRLNQKRYNDEMAVQVTVLESHAKSFKLMTNEECEKSL